MKLVFKREIDFAFEISFLKKIILKDQSKQLKISEAIFTKTRSGFESCKKQLKIKTLKYLTVLN